MNRLVDYFISLVEIDSESKDEKKVAEKIANDLSEMGAEVIFDNAHHATQGNVGNLIANFKGKIDKTPLLLCAHTDTVKPGIGIKAVIKDGYITSDGSTILGSDDKSGIAQIVEAIRRLDEEGYEYAPIQVLFTISEELGLLGAKNLDYSLIKAEVGYALDWNGVGTIVTQAPSLNIFEIIVTGKEAHSGGSPEKGINAIQIAGEAIGKLKLGRIDFETTANIGFIKGGAATNVIPDYTEIWGEARSREEEKLIKITDEMIDTFIKEVESGEGRIEYKLNREYNGYKLDENDRLIEIIRRVSNKLSFKFILEPSMGGSDANIFYTKGIKCAVLGTGMTNVHTPNETILVEDLINSEKMVEEIIVEYFKE